MAVTNGQQANATNFNNAFLSRTQDSDTVGQVGLNHTGSGSQILDVQQQINDNIADIAQNASDIASNDIDITNLQATAPTADQKDALAGTSGSPSVTNKYVTNADTRIPSQDENDALVGTDGTPSSSNKYVTNSDPRVPTQDENDALVGTDGTPSSANPFVTNSDPRLGGGGGGAGALWFGDTDAPVETYEQGIQKYFFSYDEIGVQKLYLPLNVPSGYTAGNQIKVYLKVHTPATANDYNMQIVTTLIRDGTDAITSTTNQNTADSGDITATTADLYKMLTINLTDASGEVNSVAVSANDLLILELTRKAVSGTDTTEDVKFVPSTCDFTFV